MPNSYRRLALSAACIAALGACAHYEPRPPTLDSYAARHDSRTLPAAPGGVWTDEALLSAAIANSATVRQAAAAYRSARAAARAARTPPPATLLLTAEYSRDAGGTTPWLLSGLFDIPLDRGAHRSTRLNSADLTALQALYDYAEAIWAVRSALVHAHIDRLAADRSLALAEDAVRLRRDRAARLEARIRAGEDARAAGLLAQTELTAAERKLQDARALSIQADVALATALGVSPKVVEAMPLQPLADAPPHPAAADLAAWRQQASLRRRDVLRAVADYDIAEQALRLEVARQYPDIHVGPGYTFERGQHKLPFDLTLVLPPWDLNRASIHAAEARRVEAGARLDTMQAGVLTGVDQAAEALAAAQAGLDRAVRQDLPLVRRTASAADAAFQAGALDRTEQETAQAAVRDAELLQTDFWRQAWAAAADLEDALRRPSPGEAAVLEAAVAKAGEQP